MECNIFWLERQPNRYDSFIASKCLNTKLEIALCRACGFPDCTCPVCIVLGSSGPKTKAKRGTLINNTQKAIYIYIYVYIYIYIEITVYCGRHDHDIIILCKVIYKWKGGLAHVAGHSGAGSRQACLCN